ncbi:MAG TPA: hypothetical protein GXX36_01630 [Clostridiaceae bacterium]|nr:hypothetical protein [Clostridiaceae bacterium]
MKLSRADKVKLVLFIIFRAIAVLAGIIAVINNDWTNFALSILTLVVFLLPSIIEKKLSVDFPSEFEIAVLIFIFAALYLGEMRSYYVKYWWWDLFLHTFSGSIIGAIGFSLVDILNKNEKVAIKLSPIFVSIFSFCFALAIGALWEIYEFAMDTFFGLNMQKSGLVDTMTDLIVDTLGALVFSVLGYLHLKGKINLLDRFIGKIRDWNKDPEPVVKNSFSFKKASSKINAIVKTIANIKVTSGIDDEPASEEDISDGDIHLKKDTILEESLKK